MAHLRIGQRGVGIVGSLCHIVPYVVVSLHPPYPVLIVCYAFAGFGNGLLDAAWNAWVGNMADVNEILGCLHAFYGLGAMLSPLIATALISKAGWPWYAFYYVMVRCLPVLASTPAIAIGHKLIYMELRLAAR